MKRVVICALVLLMSIAAFGQKRRTRNSASGSAMSGTRAVCKGEPVPKGFVVVGYKSSERCGENSEAVIKRPANTEIVCEGSPVPEGYHVVSQQGSTICWTADTNPLINAVSIARDSLAALERTATTLSREPDRRTGVTVRVERDDQDEDEQKPKSIVERRAAEEHNKTQIELAILHHQVIVGMTKEQVLASWGYPTDGMVDGASSSGTDSMWFYRRGNQSANLYFDNGILRSWNWNH